MDDEVCGFIFRVTETVCSALFVRKKRFKTFFMLNKFSVINISNTPLGNFANEKPTKLKQKNHDNKKPDLNLVPLCHNDNSTFSFTIGN